MSRKLFFTYNDIHKTIKKLAKEIKESGFNPDLMVAIGTGGFIPARIMKTFLNISILTVGVKYYDKDNKIQSEPEKIQWIDEVEKKLKGKKILLVDEVDDSRSTLEYCLRELLKHEPEEIAVAVLHKKNKKKSGVIPKEIKRYHTGKTIPDCWCCYPWDADDIEKHDSMSKE